jgi:hypothetical protein
MERIAGMNKIAQPEPISAGLSGVAGEYFVAAELTRRGYIAALTIKNARGIDILASKPGTKRAVTIQVKAIRGRGKEWLLGIGDEKPLGPNHFYVLVALNDLGPPEYHIVPAAIIAKECKEYHAKWIKQPKRDGGARKNTTMRSFWPRDRFSGKWESLGLEG